ncbi:MAG: ABC transporter ATP-binding protein [Butyrivibrio sp.]|nr:ABC transporter ATP-binding protein [Butyrivibrio sp.]
MSVIELSHVSKKFGDVTVLNDFSDKFIDGEFITLLGPSGCGKTTMLRMIAGFEKPSTGEIRIDGNIVSGGGVFVPPEKRGIGMVFQTYAVWPHMNVFDNVAYPLKIQKKSKQEIREKVEQVLGIVHLSQYIKRMPSELSGGQQQRVALGRALAAEPKVLLLDEPLSNLDAKLREEMRFEIKEIAKKLNINVVYVTHDQSEAMTMSDRVIVINSGVVQQQGTPVEVYTRPTNPFVADFVGKVNFLKGTASNGRIQLEGTQESLLYNGDLSGRVDVAIRPENIHIVPLSDDGIKGKIVSEYYMGENNDCRIQLGQNQIRTIADAGSYGKWSGQDIGLEISDFMVFPESGEDYHKILT